jgi:hypothetical protein
MDRSTDESSVEDAPAGRIEKIASRACAFDDWMERLLQRMWSEAVDYDHPGWPPVWLKGVSAAAIGAVLLGLIPLIVGAISALALGFGDSASTSGFAYVVLDPVRDYLVRNTRELPLTPGAVYAAWKFTGAAVVVLSAIGFRGGRVGWVLFGLLTLPMVWLESPISGRWVACGIAVAWWLLIMTFLLGFSGGNGGDRRGHPWPWKQNRSSAAAKAEATAEGRARALGFDTLEEYFGDKGNQGKARLGQELRVSAARADALRNKYLPCWATRGKVRPKVQLQIIERHVEGEVPVSTLAKELDLSAGVIKGVINRYENFRAEHAEGPDPGQP